MTDGLRDIIIKIVPELDDKDYKKHLQEMADNSKSAMEKAFRNLDKSISIGFDNWEKGLAKGDTGWKSQIKEYINTFKELQNYMQETGNLPDGMTSKLYDSYANVKKIYDMYVSAGKEAARVYEETASTTIEYDAWLARIDSINRSYQNIQSHIVDINTALNAATEIEGLKGQLGTGADKMVKDFIEIKKSIDAARVEYERLKREVDFTDDYWNRNDPKGIRAEGREEGLRQLVKLQEELNKAEANYKGQQRRLNFYGKNRELLEQIYQLTKETEYQGSTHSVAELNKELEKAKEKANALKTQLDEIGSAPENKYQENLSDEYLKAKTRVEELENELVVAAQRTGEMQRQADKAGLSFNKARQYVWSLSRVLGNIYTVGLDIVQGAKKIANLYMRIWNTAKKVLGVLKQWGKHFTGTVNEHAKSFKQMIKDVLRYSIGIRSLFALFRRLRRYIKEAFLAMAEQIPEVNAQLASLKSSLYALKGSLATMLEPLLSAFATQLQAFIDLLAKAITYVGMFFAALTGRSFVYKANKVAQTIGKAAGAAKELNKQLQGFDELNNLTTNKNSGSGGDTPLAQFEKVDIPDWLKNLAQKIKDILKKLWAPIKAAWDKVGKYVTDAWKRAFNSVKDLLHDIGRDFLTVWGEMGESIAEHFFLILGDIGHIVANIADKIREAWNYIEDGQTDSNGIRFWKAILGIVDAILVGVRKITLDIKEWTANINITPAMTAFVHWLESLVPITEMVMEILYQFWVRALKPILTWAFDGENSGVARFFQILADFNNNLDKEKIIDDLNRIWDAIGRFGINIGEGLLTFMEKMLGYLSNWLNSDDFTQWCQDVADFLDGLNPEDLADDLEQVWRIIKNIAEEAWKAIQFVIEHKDQILDFLEWCSKHLKLILGLWVGGKLLVDFLRLVANIWLAKDAFKAIWGLLQNILPNLSGFFTGMLARIQLLPTTIMQALGTELPAVGATLGTTLAAALVAAFVGYQIGNKLVGPWLHPEDKELYENFRWFEGEDSFFQTIFNEDPDTLKKAWHDMWYDMGGDLEEAVDTWKERTNEHLEDLQKWKDDTIGDIGIVGDGVHTFGLGVGVDVTQIVEDFKTLFTKIKEKVDDIKKKFEDFKTNASTKFNDIKTKIAEFSNDWSIRFTNLQTNFANFKNNVVTTLTNLKTNFVNIFNGIKNSIKAPINAILGFIERLVNGVVDGFNSLGSKLSSFKFDIPDTLAEKFDLPSEFKLNVPKLSRISIPRLAQGAVIPPNKEFLAVLGDQKRGTNIEAPLDTMVQAFNMANRGGNEQEIALLQEQNELLRQLLQKEFGISENAIYNSVRNQDRIYRKSTGSSGFVYV